ncbi:hypothetical protein J7J39_02885 [bacterium]|nr:hypothetical protein [bacterium]
MITKCSELNVIVSSTIQLLVEIQTVTTFFTSRGLNMPLVCGKAILIISLK